METSRTVRKRSDLSSASSEESIKSPNAKRFNEENSATMGDVARGVQSGQNLTLASKPPNLRHIAERSSAFDREVSFHSSTCCYQFHFLGKLQSPPVLHSAK